MQEPKHVAGRGEEGKFPKTKLQKQPNLHRFSLMKPNYKSRADINNKVVDHHTIYYLLYKQTSIKIIIQL